MTVINTNIKSILAQNSLISNNRAMSSTMEQLSTGKRINTAKDDAAGLAITARMTTQIRGLDQAVRNAGDAVSMLQTAEGAMIEMSSMFQRMRELSVQAANDTNTESDRRHLDNEFQQLKQEAVRITKNTQWNAMNILDGSFKGNDTAGLFRFQVGANEGSNQIITHTLIDMGYTDSAGTAVFDQVTAPAAAAKQESKLTIAGDYVVGDSITVTIGEQIASYTVVDDDIKTSLADTRKAIAASLVSAFANKFTDITVAAQSTADNTIKFTHDNNDTPFTPSAVVIGIGLMKDLQQSDILSLQNANSSISGLDNALNALNSERAEIGAKINRLNYSMDNLSNISMNSSASRSRILDADYAKASAELARTQIISQAATAMLAQANQQPQAVLQLLQG